MRHTGGESVGVDFDDDMVSNGGMVADSDGGIVCSQDGSEAVFCGGGVWWYPTEVWWPSTTSPMTVELSWSVAVS